MPDGRFARGIFLTYNTFNTKKGYVAGMKESRGKHLILIGFMGTGKTTVGKVLAKKLSMPLVDTDIEVEQKAGCTISQIFCKQGEAFFRQLERKILQKALFSVPSVITTGGGIVLRRDNVEDMRKGGWVVALTAERDEVIQRLENDSSRPLLKGDMQKQIDKLLSERRESYCFADFTVDTTGRSVTEIAGLIGRQYQEYLTLNV